MKLRKTVGMKLKTALVLAAGVFCACSVERIHFLNCMTFERKSTLQFRWLRRRDPETSRERGWMVVNVSHPLFGLMDKFGGCCGYFEGTAFGNSVRLATLDATGRRPAVDTNRVLRTFSVLAMDAENYGVNYWLDFSDDIRLWYHSLFVCGSNVSATNAPDGTEFLDLVVENHSGEPQTIDSIKLDGVPVAACHDWGRRGPVPALPVSFPFAVPADGEFPGVFLRLRIPLAGIQPRADGRSKLIIRVSGKKDVVLETPRLRGAFEPGSEGPSS